MKKFLLMAILLLIFYDTQAQVGIGIPNPHPSATLELDSKKQGFLPPRLTTAERDAIPAAAQGLVIFNTTTDCLEWLTDVGWYNACGGNFGVVTEYVCNTASAGTMSIGVPVSGVTQTITATVTKLGNYNISAVANGVIFIGSGTFTALGAQNIVLIATGTPTATGTNTFAISGTPTCSFTRVTNSGGIHPPGESSSYVCNTASTGTMAVGIPVSGVTQTITSTVTKLGTYNISAVANGV